MKKQKNISRILVKAALSLSLICLWSLPTTLAQGNPGNKNTKADEKSVEAAVQQFYVALNAMFTGDVEPMKEVWSHADDVNYMGPGGGIRIGWEEVLADWESQAALNLGGKVEPGEVHVTVGPKIAVAINQETGENVDPDGNPMQVSIRATHIFRKEKGQWKMIGDHADLLPFLQK